MQIDDATFVVLDTETDNVDPAKAQLLEVAAIHMDANGNNFARFQSLVKPERPIPPEASAIHGLVDDDFRHAPERDVVVRALYNFIPHDAIVVAYHAEYDCAVLRDLQFAGGEMGNRECVWTCAERLAHHVIPEAPNFKLQTIRYFLGHVEIDTDGLPAHRAMADVLVTARVFHTLLSTFRDVRADASLSDFLDLIEAPYIVQKLPFGKHFGQLVADVPTSYISWALRSMTDLSRDLRFTFERELSRRGAAA